jgi:CO/xanthine dehydrogenase Mo-binding subunit
MRCTELAVAIRSLFNLWPCRYYGGRWISGAQHEEKQMVTATNLQTNHGGGVGLEGAGHPEAVSQIRSDGKEKVTGTGRYTADLSVAGQLHAAFRYADHPHARILRVDTTRAKAVAGVVVVVTHDDVPEVRYGGMVQDRFLFAKDVVRFEGEIIAGVAAMTEAAARHAASLIDIEYEVLPSITDFEAAMDPAAPLVHEEWKRTVAPMNSVAIAIPSDIQRL